MEAISDKDAVARYAENAARLVPGYQHLQTMAGLLLAETVGENARILVLSAGGGQELKTMVEMRPTWQFVGVDPSAEMLRMAKATLGDQAERVEFHEGYIDTAPDGPFDGAVCLLTLHFLPEEERRQTVAALANRLKPGAHFVVAHHSFPVDGVEKLKWLKRYAAFATASGVPAADAENAIKGIGERLPVLSPEQDAAILRDAGFKDVALFYAAFSFKGWVGTKG